MTGLTAAVDKEQSLQMEWVRVERKCTVTPAKPAGLGRMCRLAPSDLQMINCNYIQKGLLYRFHNRYRDDEELEHELDDDVQQANLVEVLKQGLAQVLVHFYPLAGRFSVCSEGTVCIHCNDAGADFIEASAPSLSLAQVERPDVGSAVRQLFAANGSVNTDGYNMPLLLVKVSRLQDGIFVALTMNHAVADGTSLWHFINSWAHICSRVPGPPSLLPQHGRCFDAQGSPPLCLNVPRTSYASAGAFMEPSPDHLVERIFHFRADTIADLKRAANKTISLAHPTANVTPKPTYSSFQALSAHIWQAITRARGLDAAAPTTFRLAINCRPRLSPPLPPAYFGNAIQIVSVVTSAADVANNDLGQVADMLHRVIVGHRDGRIRAQLERYGLCPVMFSLDNSSNNDNVVMMGSSPRFPMYDNDFGWGRPVAVRSGWGNKFDGKLSAYPSEHSSSCVDVEMCLHPQTLDALLSDPLFLAASSSSSPCPCSASS